MRHLIAMPLDILRRMPWLIGTMVVVGAMLGGAVVPAVQGMLDMFDQQNPVVVVRATVLSVTAEDIVVRLSGEKRRDCQYIGLQAYTRAKGARTLADAYIRRLDMPETGITRPIGTFASMGEWRIWPRADAGVVLIYAQHSCGGRLVISKIADIMLPERPTT